MSTIARACLARGTVCQRARREASLPQTKIGNVQQRLANTQESARSLINRASMKSLAWTHTFKAIGSAAAAFLFTATLTAGSLLLICAAASNPISIIFALFFITLINTTVGLGVGLYLAKKCVFHARVADLSWEIVRNTRPQTPIA